MLTKTTHFYSAIIIFCSFYSSANHFPNRKYSEVVDSCVCASQQRLSELRVYFSHGILIPLKYGSAEPRVICNRAFLPSPPRQPPWRTGCGLSYTFREVSPPRIFATRLLPNLSFHVTQNQHDDSIASREKKKKNCKRSRAIDSANLLISLITGREKMGDKNRKLVPPEQSANRLSIPQSRNKGINAAKDTTSAAPPHRYFPL